jgi:molybdopterin molybdotransferase
MADLHDLPWHEARRRAADSGTALPAERVSLGLADRRVLATDVCALVDLPGFDSSAMDGWAVAGDPPWAVIGDVLAGDDLPAPLLPGSAVRIATGAPIPDGTDAIIRTENGRLDDVGRVVGTVVGSDIRHRGEECRAGHVLATKGTRLTPPLIGLLAAAGHDDVLVAQRPRVRLVLMGDELLETGLPAPGQVRDALGPQLPAWIARAGADVVDTRRVPDSLSQLITALVDGGADLIISTGGTAAGPRDHVHAAIEQVGGTLTVDGVAVRPGHPMVLADLGAGRPPLVALPGNPQAAVVGLLTLALPLIAAQLGATDEAEHSVVLGEHLNAPDDQTRMVGGVITVDGFRKSTFTGSAMLRGLAASTGYAVIPPGGAAPGDTVPWLPLA